MKKLFRKILGKQHQSPPQAKIDPKEVPLPQPANGIFKDIHKGERCFILATGPSIKNQDLTFLKGEHCFAVSYFHLHHDIQTIKPKYHVLAPTHEPFVFSDTMKYFADFQHAYCNHDVTYFLGLRDYQYSYPAFFDTYPNIKPDKVFYLDYNHSKELNEENCQEETLWDITNHPFGVRTVIYSAIQIAYYMGFEKIYLVGCDHDYLQDTKRVTNHHFYKEESGISDKAHLEAFSTERWFFEYYMRWKQYRLMKNFLAEKNTTIFNATDGGMLDVFERVDLQSLKPL